MMIRIALSIALICALAGGQAITSAAISISSASGDQTVIAAKSGTYYEITGWTFSTSAAVSVTVKSGVTALSGAMPVAANEPVQWSSSDNVLTGGIGAPLILNLSGSTNVGGTVWYREIAAAVSAYYVDDTLGSDSNTGESADAPLQTLSAATGKIADGTAIYLKRGETFQGSNLALTAPLSSVTVTAYGSGALPIIDGQNARKCLESSGTGAITDLVIQDVAFTNGNAPSNSASTDDCIYLNHQGDANGLVVKDCTFTGGEIGILLNFGVTSSGISPIIEGCTFTDCSEDGVTVLGKTYVAQTRPTVHVVVRSCTFDDIGEGNADPMAGDSVSAEHTAHITCHDCTFTGCRRGQGASLNMVGTNRFYRNLIVCDVGSTSIAAQGTSETIMHNCIVIVEATATVTQGMGPTNVGLGAGTFRAFNCSVRNRSTSASSSSFSQATGGTLEVRNCVSDSDTARHVDHVSGTYIGSHNCWDDDPANPNEKFRYASTAYQHAGFVTQTGQEASAVLEDPTFANAAGSTAADLQLQSGSPCIDTGRRLGAGADFGADYFGTRRPQNVAWDIGAHERQ